MSMTMLDARAMAVKMLTEDQVHELHDLEAKWGSFLLPFEIAQRFKHMGIKEYWGIPDNNAAAQEAHASRIGREIASLMRKHYISGNIGDPEARANFDWHIHKSDIEFGYQGTGGKSLSKQVKEMEEAF